MFLSRLAGVSLARPVSLAVPSRARLVDRVRDDRALARRPSPRLAVRASPLRDAVSGSRSGAHLRGLGRDARPERRHRGGHGEHRASVRSCGKCGFGSFGGGIRCAAGDRGGVTTSHERSMTIFVRFRPRKSAPPREKTRGSGDRSDRSRARSTPARGRTSNGARRWARRWVRARMDADARADDGVTTGDDDGATGHDECGGCTGGCACVW